MQLNSTILEYHRASSAWRANPSDENSRWRNEAGAAMTSMERVEYLLALIDGKLPPIKTNQQAAQPVTAPDRLPPHTLQQLELFEAANGG